MKILIDIGNTRLKWGCEHAQTLQTYPALAYKETAWQTQLQARWQSLPPPEKLAISSVAAPDIVSGIIELARQLWSNIEVSIAQATAKNFGVTSGYKQPEKLGVDRWLCLLATWQQYQQAAWIVDCGSAITLDFINAHGIHAGGVIAPGLTLMKKSLTNNTAKLNFSSQTYPAQLATFTDAAIFTGTLYAAVGLIEQTLKQQPAPAMLLLTGGDALLIAAHLSQSVIIDPDLVLKGLSLVA